MANNGRRLTIEEQEYIAEAEARIADRLAEAEKAHAEGRLAELIRDAPSVKEQLRPFFDDASA